MINNPHISMLLIENDLPICDLIAGQFLNSAEFQVHIAQTASDAFQSISRLVPDVIISNLNLPDLNAKDILITLALQGLEVPVIVYSEKGKDHEVVQAIRVGAAGYFQFPPGEAEFAMVLNRALNLVRAGKKQDGLIGQLEVTSKEPDKKISDIDTILAIKKGLNLIRTLDEFANKTLEAAIYISDANCGWLLMKQGSKQGFVLSAHRNIPQTLVERIRQNWDDGLSPIVALSGDPLSGYGSQLEFSLISRYGGAAMVSPIKIGRELIGLLVVIRKTPIPFSDYSKNLLEIVMIIASAGYSNSRENPNPLVSLVSSS